VRVIQNGAELGRLSAIRRDGDRLTAIWLGAPPPFGPSEQVEPFVLESDDGLERRDGWLYRVSKAPGETVMVEIGSEKNAPPWRRSAPPPSRGAAPAKSPHEGKLGQEILVVDDDPEIVDLVADALEVEGWIVRRASSGREALRMIAEQPPDVAIVDLIMPEISGEDVCAEIRRNPKLARTRVLVLSAAEDTRLVAAACDADGAVMKPFTVGLLIHEVRRLVGL
jgi:CheY-like chemotaxis protein